jgi:hypothetical protein
MPLLHPAPVADADSLYDSLIALDNSLGGPYVTVGAYRSRSVKTERGDTIRDRHPNLANSQCQDLRSIVFPLSPVFRSRNIVVAVVTIQVIPVQQRGSAGNNPLPDRA